MTRSRPPQPTSIERFDFDIAEVARRRHTAKAYRPEPLSASQTSDLIDLLRWSASSVNSQPWHFIVATTDEGRDRIAVAGTDGEYAFNSDAVRRAGMVVVFAVRKTADPDYLDHLLEVEDAAGRFPTEAIKAEMRQIRQLFVDIKRDRDGSSTEWMSRQVYWNGGQFLLGAAAMGLDATPMEGIDIDGLDAAFGLAEKGYTSLFAVTVGRNDDPQDWNHGLPKSRLPLSEIVTRI